MSPHHSSPPARSLEAPRGGGKRGPRGSASCGTLRPSACAGTCTRGTTVSNHWLLQWTLSLQVREREGCSDYFIWRAQLASVLVFFSHYSCARATPHFQRGHCFFSRHHLYAVAGRARVGEQSWKVRPVARVLGLKHSGDR